MGAELVNISGKRLLSEFLFNFRYGLFIGKDAIPIAPLGAGNRIFRVQTFNESPYRIPTGSGKTGPRGKVEQVEIDASQNEFSVEDCYLEEPVDIIESEQAQNVGMDRKMAASEFIGTLLELIYEKDVATFLTTQANYLAGFFSTPGVLWSTPATATPLTDILTANRVLDAPMTKLIMGQKAWDNLVLTDQVRTVFGIGGGSMNAPSAITTQLLGSWFTTNIKNPVEVYVGVSKYNAAKPGQANSIQYLWDNDVVLLHQVDQPTKFSITHSFSGSELQADSQEHFDKDPGPRGSIFVRQGWNYKIVLKNQRLGYLLENVVA
ncbi:hypothetical protein L0152_07265 [bacterium]|nr:hypothetical protein [bacterium]